MVLMNEPGRPLYHTESCWTTQKDCQSAPGVKWDSDCMSFTDKKLQLFRFFECATV